jgi:hypothetical protein
MNTTNLLLEHAFQISDQLPSGDPLKNSLDDLLAQVSDLVDVRIGDLLNEHGRLNTVTEVEKGIAYSFPSGKPPNPRVQIYLCPNGNQACQAVADCPYHKGFKRYGSEAIPACPQTHQPLQLFTEL